MEDWEENEKLHFAVMENSIDEVKAIIESGASIENFDDCDKTPLHYAVEQENFQIAQYLIEHGANVNAQDIEKCGDTPLGNIGATCSLKMAKFLVNHGANPAAPGWMQLSAIHRAKDRKKQEGVEVYEFLLQSTKT